MHVPLDLWNQFGANPAGSGFRAVNSIGATALRWESDLQGPAGTSSPVFGPDGTIYVGTTNGKLRAIEPAHGQIRWTRDIAGTDFLVRTPAVADDGTIYCLCTSAGTVRDQRTGGEPRGWPSSLVAVGSDGTVRWREQIRALPDLFGSVNGVTFGAPRVVSGPQGVARVIFVVRYTPVVPYPELGEGAAGPSFVCVLAIVDEHGNFLLFNRYEDQIPFVDVHGGGGGWPGGATLEEPDARGLPKSAVPCLDTPVVFGSFPAREPWTIVAPGNEGLYELKWSEEEGALAHAPTLLPIENIISLAAAFPNGLLTGTVPNAATFIDADTFTTYLPNKTSLGGPATVAGGLRQMYFVTRYGDLIAVDSNGAVWKHRDLDGGSVAFPALSGNHVHVASTQGLHTFTLDLQDVSFVRLGNGGFSSPAIGPDGVVYMAAGTSLFSFIDLAPRLRLIQSLLSRIRVFWR